MRFPKKEEEKTITMILGSRGRANENKKKKKIFLLFLIYFVSFSLCIFG